MSKGLFPFLASGDDAAPKELPLFREYVYDNADGVQLQDGSTRVVEGLPALLIWIRKALATPRFRSSAYSWAYGSELDSLMGENYSPAVTRVEAERLVREALMVSPYIKSVGAVTTGHEGDTLTVSCLVDTVYGEVDVRV